MRLPICTFMLFFSFVTSYAQTNIPLEEAVKHVADSVTVCGKVSGARFLETAKNTPTFLNLGPAFPNNALTIVIWSDVRKQFETAPEVLFKDKEVCVTGRIELYKDKPQIVLRRREDLKVK
ncbi:hypothetical protein IQ13_4170 [Lacibacter cauensis]|uniref:DNA-binding protein n=1 Tax=Lacibacter cauensis TaxID=510947 RepID=A0A562S9A6_9BACT|nr:DNA-binding protein [Lacibacter cauensis]TWI77929.1 hypothetical protein IQ13_4170 [Lacibacter cauensis]